MSGRVMVAGLGPEYNYDPADHALWAGNNTRYSSNHGASLISRSLISMFDAEYVDDFSNPEALRSKFDYCVLAFATHITARRDVSEYTRFVKQLNLPTAAFSLGIQDYVPSVGHVATLHPSMRELLEHVLATTGRVGVRGPYTAMVLRKAGFPHESIVPIGCPTLFSGLDRSLRIDKPETFEQALVVFHATLGELDPAVFTGATLLGQDFLDELIFAGIGAGTNPLVAQERERYANMRHGEAMLRAIRNRGQFTREFEQWFGTIGRHDFIYGARLHGNISALIQGIPAFMLARDLRVREIAEMFALPYLAYDDVGRRTNQQLFDSADYASFNAIYPRRFDNFIRLMHEIGALKRLASSRAFEVPQQYFVSDWERSVYERVPLQEVAQLQAQLARVNESLDHLRRLHRKLGRLPLLGRIYRRMVR